MARNRSTPDESTSSDEPFARDLDQDEAEQGESSAVHVDDNNPSVDFLAVDEGLQPDSKVHCSCGAVEWDSQDASMGAIAADLDGSRHTIDECQDLEALKAEQAGKSEAKSDEG